MWNNNSDNSEILVNYINVLIANNNVSEAKNLIKTLKEKLGDVEIKRLPIGPVIGAHCGPGTVGMIYLANER